MTMVKRSGSNAWRRPVLILPIVAALMAGTSSMVRAQDQGSKSSTDFDEAKSGDSQYRLVAAIEGSWIYQIDNLSQGNTFNSLISFTAGGVVVTSASLPNSSPFYGSWRQAGRNSFNAAFYTFIPDVITKGVATAKLTLRLRLTSRNELTGTGVGYTCDVQGENCTPGDSFQFTGKRLRPE